MKWCNGLGPNHSNINRGQHPHFDFFCFFFKYSTLKKLEQIRKNENKQLIVQEVQSYNQKGSV